MATAADDDEGDLHRIVLFICQLRDRWEQEGRGTGRQAGGEQEAEHVQSLSPGRIVETCADLSAKQIFPPQKQNREGSILDKHQHNHSKNA